MLNREDGLVCETPNPRISMLSEQDANLGANPGVKLDVHLNVNLHATFSGNKCRVDEDADPRIV